VRDANIAGRALVGPSGNVKGMIPRRYARRLFAAPGGRLDCATVSRIEDRWRRGRALRPSGEEFPIEFQLRRAPSAAGLFIAFARDRSAATREQEELRRARRQAALALAAKAEFLANMSHEIRTPLNAVLGMTDLMGETPLREDQAKYVAVCRRAGGTLLAIVDNILDLSKVEGGKMRLESRVFDLHALVAGIADSASPQAGEKRLAFSARIAADAPRYLRGDQGRVRQIAMSLIGNAIKFTSAGAITMELSRLTPEGGVALSVRDSGPGFPPDFSARMFHKFSQVDSSVTRKHPGAGLGLAICKSLADAMGGSISASSRVGEGSEFILRLPLETSDRGPAPARPAACGALRVLLVDDSIDNRALVQAYLATSGIELEIAQNGAEGAEMARERKYSLILMDMQMPVMDGYSATAEIRRREREFCLERAPILALTAHALKEDVKRCFNAGCDGHLAKPVAKAQLIEAIQFFARDSERNVENDERPDQAFAAALGGAAENGPARPYSLIS
jgi:signal transduction histidine kinase/CheY-like chemotaxis protein